MPRLEGCAPQRSLLWAASRRGALHPWVTEGGAGSTGWQELCPAPLVRAPSPRPGLFALLASRERGVVAPDAPADSQPKVRVWHQESPVGSRFPRGNRGPAGGHILPRDGLDAGSQEAESKLHGE